MTNQVNQYQKQIKRGKQALQSLDAVLPPAAASGTFSRSKNAPAASRNFVELSEFIQALDLPDGDGYDGGLAMSLLIQRVEALDNSSFKEIALDAFRLSGHGKWLVAQGAWAADRVYSRSKNAAAPDLAAAGLWSEDNTIKATTVALVLPPAEHARDVAWAPTVIVAIRGSETIHDWLVNANYKDAKGAVDSFLGIPSPGQSYKVHGGFLECARAMAPKIAALITTVLAKRPDARGPVDLLFTGHSAGAAVAALLFAHMMKEPIGNEPAGGLTQLKDAFRYVHAVTFAAPPVTMPALAAPPPAAGLFLSVIHEGDPIPRADGPYVRWLLALYLDAHNRVPELPPRELLNAGLPLLLRSSVLPAAPVELFRFAQAGRGQPRGDRHGQPAHA